MSRPECSSVLQKSAWARPRQAFANVMAEADLRETLAC